MCLCILSRDMIYETFVSSMLGTYVIGKYNKMSYNDISWYLALVMSMNVYMFHNIPFIYDTEYLFANVQPYEHLTPVLYCVDVYLIMDLLCNSSNKFDTLLHHVAGITGISISLLGNNVGVLNNCIRNEISTIWLALGTISHKSDLHLFKCLNPIFMMIFAITFVSHRIIPCSLIMYQMITNTSMVAYSPLSLAQSCSYIFHLGLQYYWFSLIAKNIYCLVCKKTV